MTLLRLHINALHDAVESINELNCLNLSMCNIKY